VAGIQIAGVNISLSDQPFIVAEMSGNHNQSLTRALEITEAAAKAGCQALKLQTYTADTLTLDLCTEDFTLRGENSLWENQTLYDLFQIGFTPWEWHQPIVEKAKELGMVCFSSPFDETAVEFLETLNMPAYKIASMEINHLPLIRAAASTGKPLVISTGMASLEEISEALATADDAGCKEVALMKCTSAYPAQSSDANILTIPDMRARFGCEVGLSDHTLGIAVSVAAVAQGASIIEKHFTLCRNDGGIDSAFSIEPDELRNLVCASNDAWSALGKIAYGPDKAQELSLQERRSLYVAENMKAGEKFTKDNLRCIRPSFGLPPKYYDSLLGRRANIDIQRGTALNWELVVDED